MAMATVDSADFSDIKTAGSGFSFTGSLADLTINDKWVDGYNSIVDDTVEPNSYTSLWAAISSGTEESGNTFYKAIRNYIDEIGNIDTCGVDALRNYASILGVKSEYLDLNISFPVEIKNLVEVLSVNPAYLYNKATDGSNDTLVLSNSILHYTTVEQFLSALSDKDKFIELLDNVFYNTIIGFLNLKTTTFDDSENGNKQTEIWRTDTSRFIHHLWNDDITSDKEIYALKESLGVAKSFTEKVYADDIISGNRKMSDFSDIEQAVIKAEMKSRETRYGDSNAMRYYYMRLFKVVEYFRFATITYNSVYELEKYELNENKYSIIANSDNRLSLLKFNYNEYEIDVSAVRKVSRWLASLCLSLRGVREDMKSQCRRNMMVGTKKLIVDIVRKFVLDKIDGGLLNDMRSSILHSAGLNKKFGVSIIEYSDMTEYFNIENSSDMVKPSEHSLHNRYWEMYDDAGSAFTSDDVLSFYNRLFGDSKKFMRNTADGVEGGSDNLYEFLSLLFESGATSVTNSDYYLSSNVYTAGSGTELTSCGVYSLSDDEKAKVARNSGDMHFADIPYANHKNTFHPSYQMHPFVQAFEEYNEAYTSAMNLVNSYTESMSDSFGRLKQRLDSLGNTINFWYNWNDDFSGYSTTYEKGGSDFDSKSAQDGPFNFDALQEYLTHPGEYINNILNGVNEYYVDFSTGKMLLTTDETRLEVARLQKYSTLISGLANREIYRYGKDYNGNIYILYKGEGERNVRNALGDIWIRQRNHPIAFPLFDLSLSPVRFNETSCIKETDNSKLLSLLTRILSFFKNSYGKHFSEKTVADGYLDMSDLTLTVDEYTETVPVTTRGPGHFPPSSYEFTYSSQSEITDGKFRLVDIDDSVLKHFAHSSMDAMAPCTLSSTEVSAYCDTYYFVDSVDGTIIPGGESSTYVVSSRVEGEPETDPNPTGCIMTVAGNDMFNALCDGATLSIKPNYPDADGHIIFADFEDVNSFDGKTYYCYNRINGRTHPCAKRSVKVNRLLSMSDTALSGSVGSNGDVEFGGKLPTNNAVVGGGETPFSKYDMGINAKAERKSLDGGMVYEDFGSFSYYVITPQGLHNSVPTSAIVVIGGSNPYYMDENGGGLTLRKAYTNEPSDWSSVIEFSDSIYRSSVSKPSELASYPFSSCEFVATYNDRYSDTIGQFYERGKPYTLYQPFTTLKGEPFTDPSELSPDSPSGAVTLHSKNGDDITFYYNLEGFYDHNIERHLTAKCVDSVMHSATISLTSCKIGGKIGMYPYDSSEYPIYLDFTSSAPDNVATYSSFMSEISQRKFFDMGFSYNQKMFYMSYSNDGSDEYLDGGTIVGTLEENFDENYNSTLSFHRDSIHNVEYVDAGTVFMGGDIDAFHIGDASSKRGIFAIYGKYDVDASTMEVSITLFSQTDVRTKKFGIDVRNGLYDSFDDGGSRYSFAVSCTDSRLYVSFTIKPPRDTDVISNTINGANGGLVGSTEYGKVSSEFSDYMIQILSFDITDDEIEYCPDETRFIIKGGDIGYFQLFSGIDGKSNIFSNAKLSSDFEFSFQPQFGELQSEGDIEMMRTYESAIGGFSSDRRLRFFDRFINIPEYGGLYGDNSEINGFLIEDDHVHAMYSVAKQHGEGGTAFEFESIDGRPIIDITRGLDGADYDLVVTTYSDMESMVDVGDGVRVLVLHADVFHGSPADAIYVYSKKNASWTYERCVPNHGVNIISDGLDLYNRCAAVVDSTTVPNAVSVGEKKMVLMPIHSKIEGYTSFDFGDMVDTDKFIYSLHADGREVSIMSVSSTDATMEPVSGIWEVSPSLSEVRPSMITAVGFSPAVVSLDGYSTSSECGGRRCFASMNGVIAMWFGAYGDGTMLQYKPYIYAEKFSPVPFSISGVPMVIYPVDANAGSDLVDSFIEYSGSAIVRNGTNYNTIPLNEYFGIGDTYRFRLSYGETVSSILDTEYPTTKIITTSRGYVYRYDVDNGRISKSRTYDELDKQIKIDSIDDFDTLAFESSSHILFSYGSDSRGISGMMWARKNTPDSVGEDVKFNIGISDIAVGRIVKALSVNGIVLAEEDGGYRIFISEDDGVTFDVLNTADAGIHLVGCGSSGFYARYSNGEKAYSTDGRSWHNITRFHASNWSVFNAGGRDYMACDVFDSDIKRGIFDRSKYIMVEQQIPLSGGAFEKMVVDGHGNIACLRGMDGSGPLELARSFVGEDGRQGGFEYITLPYVRNIAMSNAAVFDEDVLLSPDGGMTAVHIHGVFNADVEPSASFIDISSALNNEVNIFGGFGYANNRLIMYPSEGSAVLAYDDASGKFHRLHSFGSVMTLCDCDSANFSNDGDAIFSPRSSSLHGVVKFSLSAFRERDDYGVIEIDEGFPIVVTHFSTNTFFDGSDIRGMVYKTTFSFINDANGRTVSILSMPEGVQPSDVGIDWNAMTSAEAVYIVSGKSIKYRFRSVGSSNKFVVEKVFSEYSTESTNSGYLEIEISMENEDDASSAELYSELIPGSSGRFCVFGDITSEDSPYTSNIE